MLKVSKRLKVSYVRNSVRKHPVSLFLTNIKKTKEAKNFLILALLVPVPKVQN